MAIRSEVAGRTVSLSADAAPWSDKDRLVAAEILRELAKVELGRLIELSAATEIAKTLLEIPREIWDEVLIGAAGTAVYEALRHPVAKRRAPTVIEIRDDRPKPTRIAARVQTDDPAALDSAVKQLPEVAPAGRAGNFEFDSDRELWVPLNLED